MIPLQLLSTQPPATPTLADLLSTLSSGFTVILTAVTSACSTIVSTPFLLFTAVFLVTDRGCFPWLLSFRPLLMASALF